MSADDAALEVEVLSALGPAQPGPAALGSATGLLTMRERARSLGGDVTAGPEGDRWRVRAVLPLDGAGGVAGATPEAPRAGAVR